jgi:GTP-binding protein
LGHEFLRHIHRTKMLVHVLDSSGGLEGRDPLVDFDTINAELGEYDPELLERPMLVALNKVDIPETQANLKRLRKHMAKLKLPVFEISAATGEGVQALLNEIGSVLREIAARPVVEPEPEIKVVTIDSNERSFQVTRTGPSSFLVTGTLIERTTRMTNFDQIDSGTRYQNILKSSGIAKELERQGIEVGDTVTIAEMELIWGELEELEPKTSTRRTARERYLNRKSRTAD